MHAVITNQKQPGGPHGRRPMTRTDEVMTRIAAANDPNATYLDLAARFGVYEHEVIELIGRIVGDIDDARKQRGKTACAR